MRCTRVVLLLLAGLAVTVQAAEPPDYVNYQGVLRDADGHPLDGDCDMEFHLYDSAQGGNRLLSDVHRSTEPIGPVVVTGGLFNVHLGEGTIVPGTHATLGQVFGDREEVWLEVEIQKSPAPSEVLDPRIRVIAAPYALNAGRLDGRPASGFVDTSANLQVKLGGLAITAATHYGVEAHGVSAGGHFNDSDQSGYANVGVGDMGIEGYGSYMGGYFKDIDNTSEAKLAFGSRGIEAFGSEMGGYFEDADGNNFARVAYFDRGIDALGTNMGGMFVDLDEGGHAFVGVGDRGIEAYGTNYGAYFVNGNTGRAYVAYDNRGIEGRGADMGGYFEDSDQSGYAHVAYADKGIEGFGSYMGGYFKDTDDLSDAKVAFGGYGIRAYGNTAGGRFDHLTSGNWAELGGGASKIIGNGANPSFVQNHPVRDDRVIVYAAPGGNEIATYTRGTARLVAGEARVALDETFKWVTSPDIGLSAHLTPRGECNGLYVDALTTEELRVRELGGGGGDVIFDYIVWGLRVGFEELPVVQEKTRDAYLPRIDETLTVYDRLPELRRHNAFERFRTMRAANGETGAMDLSASLALRNAIGVYDPAIHGADDQETPTPPRAEATPQEVATTEPPAPAARAVVDGRAPGTGDALAADDSSLARYPTSEAVEAGEVVVLDPDRPGYLRRASGMADPTVFGIAVGDTQSVDGQPQVRLVEGRYADVKADASYGAILPGDLLVSSPTPGHVMRATVALPGTILGKAAERLEAETGSIRVLVMLR